MNPGSAATAYTWLACHAWDTGRTVAPSGETCAILTARRWQLRWTRSGTHTDVFGLEKHFALAKGRRQTLLPSSQDLPYGRAFAPLREGYFQVAQLTLLPGTTGR